jgi:hypothetical protein
MERLTCDERKPLEADIREIEEGYGSTRPMDVGIGPSTFLKRQTCAAAARGIRLIAK